MDKIKALADMILESGRIIVFTGAGISTESGIPDLYSPGEIWDKFDPNQFTYPKFLASDANCEKFWDLYRTLCKRIAQAKPNRGHQSIAELNNLGKLDCIITQNIDDLHHESGVPRDKIIELHGTLKCVNCPECGKRFSSQQIKSRLELGEKIPRCSCGSLLKPGITIFGQPMLEKEITEARQRVAGCDLLCVIGASLLVCPVAQIPLIAKDSGAKLVIINVSSTPHDQYADILIQGRIGSTLTRTVQLLKAKLKAGQII